MTDERRSKSPVRSTSPKPARSKSPKPARSKSPKPSIPYRSKSPKEETKSAEGAPLRRTKTPVPEKSVSKPSNLRAHEDDDALEEAVRRCIPSHFTLIAGQDDLSIAVEAYKATKVFQLPNAIGEEGGLATSALLQLFYEKVEHLIPGDTEISGLNARVVLKDLHSRMNKARESDIVPQMSSSRPLGPPRLATYAPFYLVPPGHTGRRRALLIGVNFMGQEDELRAPHNDVHNVQQFLMNHAGFHPEDIMVMVDDGKAVSPTKKNIEEGFAKMVAASKDKDVLFIQYSGHGGRMADTSGDEMDGFDSYILPVDHKTAGQIVDDDILKNLIKALPEGVHSTMLVDCCHSGTVGDLPYVLKANSKTQEIEAFFDTDTVEDIAKKEAAVGKYKQDALTAKAERKRQKELRLMQKEKEYQEACRRAEEESRQVIAMPGPDPTQEELAMPLETPAGTQTFTVSSEAELEALCSQYGVSLELAPEQKDILLEGGTIALSLMLPGAPAPTPQATPMDGATSSTQSFTVTSEEEVEALSKRFGTSLTLSPEQVTILNDGGTVSVTFTTL